MPMIHTDKPALPYILVDTNLLIRLVYVSKNATVVENFKASLADGYVPCVCLQNLVELWSVATRPAEVNGFDLKPHEALKLVGKVRENFEWLPDAPTTVDTWLQLCSQYAVSGRRIHDARLAATALANGVNTIATFNQSDFQTFKELTVITPAIA